MKRPEKWKAPKDREWKDHDCKYDKGWCYEKGHNQSCDVWEKWIEDNKEEMIDIHGIRHSVIKIKGGEYER